MSNSRRILIVNDHGPTYFKPFAHLGLGCTRDHKAINDPESVALVVFTGGSDVSPGLYSNNAPHPRTFSDLARDTEEITIYETALDNKIPMAGICRGAQFLCVMAGGKLVQDITGHQGTHDVLARYPNAGLKRIAVSSSHHQMQFPFDLKNYEDFEVLAFSPTPKRMSLICP